VEGIGGVEVVGFVVGVGCCVVVGVGVGVGWFGFVSVAAE